MGIMLKIATHLVINNNCNYIICFFKRVFLYKLICLHCVSISFLRINSNIYRFSKHILPLQTKEEFRLPTTLKECVVNWNVWKTFLSNLIKYILFSYIYQLCLLNSKASKRIKVNQFVSIKERLFTQHIRSVVC